MKTEAYPVLYLIADEEGEADEVKFFCSHGCRALYDDSDISTATGLSADWIDGTVCEQCSKPLGMAVSQ